MNFHSPGFDAEPTELKAPIPTSVSIIKSAISSHSIAAPWALDESDFPEGEEFRIGIDWEFSQNVDLDLFCIPVNAEGWAEYESDVIFFGNVGWGEVEDSKEESSSRKVRPNPKIGIEHSGDDLTGARSHSGAMGVNRGQVKEDGERPAAVLEDSDKGDECGLDEIIRVRFNEVPDDIVRIIFFVVSSAPDSEEHPKLTSDLNLRILTCWGYGRKGCTRTIDSKTENYDSMLIGQLFRSPGSWRFTWRGVPFSGGIAQVLPFYTDHLHEVSQESAKEEKFDH